jgi:hypothetical protein
VTRHVWEVELPCEQTALVLRLQLEDFWDWTVEVVSFADLESPVSAPVLVDADPERVDVRRFAILEAIEVAAAAILFAVAAAADVCDSAQLADCPRGTAPGKAPQERDCRYHHRHQSLATGRPK